MKIGILPLILALFVTLSACGNTISPVTDRNSQLTQGNVQLTLVSGKTTKAEVLEKFGAPNVTTRDGQGFETWTYQRAGQVNQSSSSQASINLLLLGASSNSSGFETSSRMITLIIKFDNNDIVVDFRSRTSDF
ncbi:MAG: hypothetical protein OXC26_10915 [Albidovulum sp.]|nr:hypothetical protein [Albidovulum sp.]